MLISKKKQELGEEDGAEATSDDEAERAEGDDEEDGGFFALVGVVIGVEATRGCRSDAGDDDVKAEQTTKSSII